jgi:hypothetical protein
MFKQVPLKQLLSNRPTKYWDSSPVYALVFCLIMHIGQNSIDETGHTQNISHCLVTSFV